MAASAPGSEPSVVALIRDAVRDFTVIVKGEIALASQEFKQSAAKAAAGGGVVMLVLALLGTAGLFGSISFALGLYAAGLALWVSFLIVAGVYLVIAIILGLIAMAIFKRVQGPETAARVSRQTKAYLQAALTKPAPELPAEADNVRPTSGPAPDEPAQPLRTVPLPARRPDTVPTDGEPQA